MKGVLSWLARRVCRDGTTDFCSALAALVGPVKIFFPNLHYFNAFFLIGQQAGQATVLARLSPIVCVCGAVSRMIIFSCQRLRAFKYISAPRQRFL
jgi:hypothetical protein